MVAWRGGCVAVRLAFPALAVLSGGRYGRTTGTDDQRAAYALQIGPEASQALPTVPKENGSVAKTNPSSSPLESRNESNTPPCEGVKADRAGFEPAVEFAPYAGLANRCLQPLGHLSRGSGDLRTLIAPRQPLLPRKVWPGGPSARSSLPTGTDRCPERRRRTPCFRGSSEPEFSKKPVIAG